MPSPSDVLAEAHWASSEVVARIAADHPHWRRSDGACPACVQQSLLLLLTEKGEEALHDGIQKVWPLDAEAAFGAMPSPLRLHADPRFSGRGVTIALIDSGFYPHPDLVQPRNRIRAWVDAGRHAIDVRHFGSDETPHWPGWDMREGPQWHGLMTSVAATGNGWLSHGLYRGLASDADVILIQVRDENGRITNDTIARALRWLLRHGPGRGVRVVSMSIAGDPVEPPADNEVDEAIAELVAARVFVVAAAGNDGIRQLVPPATSPLALTVGGLDDGNTFDHAARRIWHGNYGLAGNGAAKPELVAPSIWVVAPVLPGTELAADAIRLFAGRAANDPDAEQRIADCKLVTPDYQHVEGTSFAAPLVASVAACMLEANPGLTPPQLRELLTATAHRVPGATRERQGAGAVQAGRAVALALASIAGGPPELEQSPLVSINEVVFRVHDPVAKEVRLLGSWDGWHREGALARQVAPGSWRVNLPRPPAGKYGYKFLLDDSRWLTDPLNGTRTADSFGGWNSVLVVW